VRAGDIPFGAISDDLQRYTYLGLDDRHVDVVTRYVDVARCDVYVLPS